MDVSAEAPRKALREVEQAMDTHAAKHVQQVKALLESGLIPAVPIRSDARSGVRAIKF